MKEYLPVLKRCQLFAKIEPEALVHMLSCLGAQIVQIPKGGYILRQGEQAHSFGILLYGRAQIIKGDIEGSHTIVSSLEETELFAEAMVCAALDTLPVSVVACEACTVMMLRHERIMKACARGCIAHSQFIAGLLRIISQKNLILNQKMEIVMRRTTQEKLMTYLQMQSVRAGTRRFVIPYDRQGLADFLGVERSAMSTELSKMRKAGLIDFHKNEFEIL